VAIIGCKECGREVGEVACRDTCLLFAVTVNGSPVLFLHVISSDKMRIILLTSLSLLSPRRLAKGSILSTLVANRQKNFIEGEVKLGLNRKPK
jgi:uncharacterized protein (DUF983 family)